MKKILFISFLIFNIFSNAQNLGVGASGLYNFQSESWGIGPRASLFPNNTISYVPQFSYYLFGPVSEFTAGLGIELKIKRGNLFTYYLLAHGGYNQWLNSGSSAMEGAQGPNWNLEGGGGITTNRCLRPFIEYRYNVKFQETHLQLGLMYIFGCGGNGGSYRNPQRMKNAVICPAY